MGDLTGDELELDRTDRASSAEVKNLTESYHESVKVLIMCDVDHVKSPFFSSGIFSNIGS